MTKSRTTNGYGPLGRVLHWVMAVLVFGLFALGYWMRTLGYYDPWYQRAPDLHRSLGVVLIALLILRIGWRLTTAQPVPLSKNRLERVLGHGAHFALYMLMCALVITGYLFATGDGKPLSVFGWFGLPSVLKSKPVADIAGNIHEWLAYGIIALAVLHMLAALKHHFIDRDDTLRRMVKASSKIRNSTPKE